MIPARQKSSEKIKGLEGVVLSLTTACDANCLYCPLHKSKKKVHAMPFSHVKKIVTELSSKNFRQNHNITRIITSSGGDPFMHKDLIKILQLIRSELPNIQIICFTNFSQFTKDMAEIILQENLVDHIKCNIDGSTATNYRNVKNLDLGNVEHNLDNFLKIRKKLGSKIPLDIKVLTLHEYIQATYRRFNSYPNKLKNMTLINIPDDFHETKEKYIKKIDPQIDKLFRQRIMFWAERKKVDAKKFDYSEYACPFIYFVKHTAIINSYGTWSG